MPKVSVASPVTRSDISLYTSLGDGDCFYRGDSTLSAVISLLMHFSSLALAFAYLDRLVRSPGRNKLDRLAVTKDILAIAGFDDCVYGSPYEILQSLVEPHGASRTNANEELWQCFTDPQSTLTIQVWHLPSHPFS